MRPFIIFFFLNIYLFAVAQEFPKGEWTVHAGVATGMITNFKGNSPDLHTVYVPVKVQYTFLEDLLRGGLLIGPNYYGKRAGAMAGPTVSVKIKTFRAGSAGSLGNLHLSFEHLWGTENEKLAGGGIHADLGNKLVAGLQLHRDHQHNNWWIMPVLAIRLNKVKQPEEP